MNEYGIPIMEPAVDYTKVLPIHQKRTITFVNHFLVHTVTYLNKFALFCEEKLFDFENKLQKVEASLEILESRLSSIPEADLSSERDDEPVSWKETNEEEIVPPENVTEVPAPTEEQTDPPEIQSYSKDARYEKYFKMIQFGVPAQAVKLKMKQDGLDPLVLDNPDHTVPKKDAVDPQGITTNTNE